MSYDLDGALAGVSALAKLTPSERIELAALYGGGNAYEGARVTRLLADWTTILTDPNSDWTSDALPMSARAWALIKNDANAAAMISTLQRLVLGAGGLQFRSHYSLDLATDRLDTGASPSEDRLRTQITDVVAMGNRQARGDAAGQLTMRDFDAQVLESLAAAGEVFGIRCWKVRPGVPLATCWRIISADRVCNPDDKPDSDTRYQGLELDADGTPIGIHIRVRSPSQYLSADKATWQYVPYVAPDGSRSAFHIVRCRQPGQLRGISMFAPLLVLAQHLGKVAEAFVVAKRASACNPMVMKVEDVAAAKAAAAVGSLLGPNFKMRPGQVAVAGPGCEIVFPQWSFQGADYQQFVDVLLRSFTAAWGFPFQLVLQQLTDANLAAAQVALDQADVAAGDFQNLLIEQGRSHIDQSFVREGIARGMIAAKADTIEDCERLAAGTYTRPRKPDANKQRTAQRAQLFMSMGGSPTTAFAEMGYVFVDEIRQRKIDGDLADSLGILIPGLNAPAVPETPGKPGDVGEPPAPPAGEPSSSVDDTPTKPGKPGMSEAA